MNIAFIGLGNMGSPMARNLLRAGHTLRVFDLSAASAQALVTEGAQTASSPAEAAREAQFVITMLPAAAHVEAVLNGEHGVLGGAPRGVPLIDCSTIDPASARRLAGRADARGHPFVDAPVSGGTAGAAAGTLTFMVGADSELFERVRPVLEGMGKNIVRCGSIGTGQTAKICNNLLLAISMLGVSEATTLGVALGIEAKVLTEVINMSSGRCWSSDTYHPYPGMLEGVPASREYRGGFGVDLMLKDLGLATDAARQVHQPVPLAALAQQLYQAWSQQGHGRLDFSSIIQLLQPHSPTAPTS